MKTLWERLNPGIALKLKEVEHEYPSIHREIVTSLKARIQWSSLSVREISTIITFTDTPIFDAGFEMWKYGEGIIVQD